MVYYSAIKKNEIMPFAAKWVDTEIIILSQVSQNISFICRKQLMITGGIGEEG